MAQSFSVLKATQNCPTMDAVLDLKRCIATVKDEERRFKAEGGDTILDLTKQWKGEASTMVQDLSNKVIGSCTSDLSAAIGALDGTYLGHIEGKSWMATFTGTKWEELLEHASSTIMKMNGSEHQKHINTLAEADMLY
eukprot:200311-Amphidinium_carterae.1